MRFSVITIFPEAFDSYLNTSILKRAQKRGLVKIRFFNPRDFVALRQAQGNRKSRLMIDDKPFGGGAGMVLKAEPVLKAVKKASDKINEKTKIVILSAKGKQFSQKTAYNWAKKYNKIIFISGRYEGIDERVKKILKAEEISIGPYVLTDGDIAVQVIISAVSRLLPGVIRLESLEEESHWKGLLTEEESDAVLEYPQYTRPETVVYKGKKYRVPKVLLSGNHAKIKEWRKKHSK